jgi:hypothetical protein
MDLFVTELLRMRGSERLGGPAGFGTASQNDVPMAAKGTIVGAAFLGVEMKCARCHDSPTGKSLQQDLFQVAAMLGTRRSRCPRPAACPWTRFTRKVASRSSGHPPARHQSAAQVALRRVLR